MNAENRTNRHTSIQIGGTVDRITCHCVPSIRVFREEDGFLLFFGDQNRALSGRTHGCDEQIIANDIEFLLVVACGVA
jgi:hypothetical protein